jgi:hypothetical protein
MWVQLPQDPSSIWGFRSWSLEEVFYYCTYVVVTTIFFFYILTFFNLFLKKNTFKNTEVLERPAMVSGGCGETYRSRRGAGKGGRCCDGALSGPR